eukprot:7935405-Pyramimonas_sp.AAC.1
MASACNDKPADNNVNKMSVHLGRPSSEGRAGFHFTRAPRATDAVHCLARFGDVPTFVQVHPRTSTR